jgi:Holliday junction resolvase
MTPEGGVKAKVRALFRELEIHYVHVPGSAYGKGGAPDYIACVKGLYMEVECKADGGRQTLLQKHQEDKCVKSGGMYVLVNNKGFQEFKEFLIKINHIGDSNEV